MYIYIYIYIHLALTNICMQADAWANWSGSVQHAAVTESAQGLPSWWGSQAATASCTAHHDI